MEQTSPRVLDAVQRIVVDGRLHCAAWRTIFTTFKTQPDVLDLAPLFFTMTAIVHFNAAILQAAKLTERRKDSINLQYLLDLLNRRARTDYPRRHSEVIAAVRMDGKTVSFFKDTIDRIKRHRDRQIAHEDRRNPPEDIFQETKPSIEDLERLFEWTHRTVSKYRLAYEGGKLLSNHPLAGIPDAGLDELWNVVNWALDGQAIPGASELVKNVQSWRSSLREARKLLGSCGGVETERPNQEGP